MKINRANNNGSVSIIIPRKAIEKLGWQVGDDCIMKIEDQKLVIEKKPEDIF